MKKVWKCNIILKIYKVIVANYILEWMETYYVSDEENS